MQFTSVELTFPRLIKDNYKNVIDLLHRVKSIQSKNRQIDCGNLLTVLQDTLLSTVDEWNDQLVQIESIAEEEDYIRSQTEASLKIQAEYERLSEDKQFFDALKQEDDFMRLTMDILSKKAELIEKVLVILQKHKNLLGQVRNLDTSCRNDLNRFKNDVEKTLLSCQSRLDTLSSFKNFLGIKRDEIEELWSQTYDQSPWLKDIIQEFLELYPQGSSVDGVKCIPIMLNWYIEEKAGQMIKEHELVEKSMTVLKEHMNAIDIFCRLTDTAFGSFIKALSFNVDTLTGKKHHLQTDIPDTYKILHDRLVLNEKLCQTNIMHLKNDINNARDKKNEAWEIRHLADLSKYEKIEAQLQKNLKEEQTRLESIERYVPQSFDIVRRHLDSTKVDAWLKELSDAGYKIKRLSQTKKRKRSDEESDMDSDGEANETGTQESGSGSQAMGIRKMAMPKSKKSRLMDFVGTAFKAIGFSWVGTEVDDEKNLPAVAEKADSTVGDVDSE
ncbi:hypothetical protein BKA69DRAFT_733057 [Paraphysoderma sedebokerense]|nr:hypothetical protein BKA69DRAFT_733057 [Paraphysoderma sedebokerense]